MYNDLINKNIYVIGGLGLLGSCFVEKYIKQAKKIIIIDNNTVKLNKNKNLIKLNISDNAFEKKITKIFSKLGPPHAMVNFSYPQTKNWKKINFNNFLKKEISQNLDLHLKAFLNCSYIFANYMAKKNIKGSIINLSSIYGIVAQKPFMYKNNNINPVYPLIKGGIINMTKQFASNYGRYDIRFNAICPGGVIDPKNKKNTMNNEFKNKYIKINPIKRMCEPIDVANAVGFLISDVSSYITGVALAVDGGWTAV
jgi:NAD(P)-dependent dehydrogenase (short-subunit alcohol dehydrogenase family)